MLTLNIIISQYHFRIIRSSSAGYTFPRRIYQKYPTVKFIYSLISLDNHQTLINSLTGPYRCLGLSLWRAWIKRNSDRKTGYQSLDDIIRSVHVRSKYVILLLQIIRRYRKTLKLKVCLQSKLNTLICILRSLCFKDDKEIK